MRRLSPSVLFAAATAVVAAGAVLASLAPGAESSVPAGFTVDTTIDTIDIAPGDGTCAGTDGHCSLRAAVMETNALPGANEINLPAGLYRLTIPEVGILQDSSPAGDLDVADDLTISGEGAWGTVIDQLADQNRILETTSHTVVHVSGVTIKGGNPVGYPGGPNADGGGIRSAGTLTLEGVSVTGNSAGRSARGGGIYANGSLTVLDSTISGNYAVYDGTGIDAGSVTIVNSTVSENFGEFGGMSGIWAGSAELLNATVANNEGLNIMAFSGGMTLGNTILAAPAGGQNCYLSGQGHGPVISNGHNIDSDGTCGLAGPSDLSGGDPQLLPLANNGGQTLTHALSPTSPAIDAGDSAACPETDQRGVARPVGAKCDIGAFEYGGVAETPGPTATPRPPSRVDIRCNGVITSEDALMVLVHVAGLVVNIPPGCEPFEDLAVRGPGSATSPTPPTGPPILPHGKGDADCDGAVTAVDALAILRYVVGIPMPLPPGCPPLE